MFRNFSSITCRKSLLVALLLFLFIPAFTQIRENPYFYHPSPVPMNNRYVSERRIACLYLLHKVRCCSIVTITDNRAKDKPDSLLTEVACFHPNGFVDSVYYFRSSKPFKFTKVGGRKVSEMQADCENDSLLTWRGPPGGKTKSKHPVYSRCVVTRYFDANGYLWRETNMRDSWLKHENSVDGSWNSRYDVKQDSTGRLLEVTAYTSHWWFFRKPSSKVTYHYNTSGLLSEKITKNWGSDGDFSITRERMTYLFEEK